MTGTFEFQIKDYVVSKWGHRGEVITKGSLIGVYLGSGSWMQVFPASLTLVTRRSPEPGDLVRNVHGDLTTFATLPHGTSYAYAVPEIEGAKYRIGDELEGLGRVHDIDVSLGSIRVGKYVFYPAEIGAPVTARTCWLPGDEALFYGQKVRVRGMFDGTYYLVQRHDSTWFVAKCDSMFMLSQPAASAGQIQLSDCPATSVAPEPAPVVVEDPSEFTDDEVDALIRGNLSVSHATRWARLVEAVKLY